jgi:hypothetical protein
MEKRLLWAALAFLVCLPLFSHSEEVFESSAVSALGWDMTNVLPPQAGLQVNSVFYRYTTQKAVEDALIVHVQNEDTAGPGYIFRSSDDWTGVPGNTITRFVPVSLAGSRFGQGSIQTEGFGTVSNPTVIYNYSYEPCFDPQSDPSCPGYVPPFEPLEMEMYDPLSDEFIRMQMERKATQDRTDEEDRDRRRMQSMKESRLEKALGAASSAMLTANALAMEAQLLSMSVIPTTYQTSLVGGRYDDSIELPSKKLPDNPSGRRVGLAQQLLHERMVDSQYD